MPSKTLKPIIEDVIKDMVNEELQQTALEFVNFIRSNRMTPSYASANSWKVQYKGKPLCYIRTTGTAHYYNLDDGSWHICFPVYTDEEYDIDLTDESMHVIWDHVRDCTRCYNCKPANRLTINGRVFDQVCHQWLFIRNPDAEELTCIMKLVDAIRRSRISW